MMIAGYGVCDCGAWHFICHSRSTGRTRFPYDFIFLQNIPSYHISHPISFDFSNPQLSHQPLQAETIRDCIHHIQSSKPSPTLFFRIFHPISQFQVFSFMLGSLFGLTRFPFLYFANVWFCESSVSSSYLCNRCCSRILLRLVGNSPWSISVAMPPSQPPISAILCLRVQNHGFEQCETRHYLRVIGKVPGLSFNKITIRPINLYEYDFLDKVAISFCLSNIRFVIQRSVSNSAACNKTMANCAQRSYCCATQLLQLFCAKMGWQSLTLSCESMTTFSELI